MGDHLSTPAPALEQRDATHARLEGRSLIYFGGCDYLRMSMHPRVRAALIRSLKCDGLNVAASRKTTGNHPLYRALEKDLAAFFNAEDALVVSTGYMSNLVVAQSVAFTDLLIDADAHPSLWDAAQLSGARIFPFAHCSAEGANKICAKLKKGSKVALLTDGMFAHDGSIAPLAEYRRVLPRGAYLWIDDAHGAGILGAHGRGSIEHEGISRVNLIQSITLSKAFGVYGGAILGAKKLTESCIRESRLFAGSTPLPLPLTNAARTAISLVSDGKQRDELLKRINYFREKFIASKHPVPIVSLTPRHSAQKERLIQSLLRSKIFPSFIRYPGGPKTGYFRFALSSKHTFEQIAALGRALSEF